MRFPVGKKLPVWALVTALVCLPILTMGVRAQDSTEESSSSAWAPPLASFAKDRIDLIEAVRSTLEHDPNLLLRREDFRLQAGVLEELGGAFDWTFSGDVTYQHDERELRDSVKRREQDRRDDLQVLNGETCSLADQFEAKTVELEDAIASEPGQIPITRDEIFNLRLRAIERLIDEATSAEIEAGLRNQRLLILEGELFETRALAEGNRNACIESGETLARLGDTPEQEEFDSGRLNLRLEKLFRSGILLAPFVEGEYDSSQFIGKRNGFFEPVLDDNGNQVVEFGVPRERFIDFGGKNVEDLYTFRVGFEVNVPLLRNRGAEAVAAGESAAERDLEATALLLKHAASESVLNTAVAYWDLFAAQERVDIQRGSVRLQEELVKITRDLIEADELPRAEESRVLASAANARAQLAGAERDLVSARLALVQAMGFDARSQESTPLAAGPFPEAPNAQAIERLLADAELLDAALGQRYDVAAAAAFVGSSAILARASQLNLRSQLDLSAGAWATATGEKSFSEATDRWVSPSWSVGLAFEKPIGNRERKGSLAQSQSRERQDQISSADLERNVRIAVVLVLNSLAEVRGRLDNAEEAAKQFERTIEAEKEKFKVRESNLVDTILTEQQRTGALLTRLDVQREVAILLARLRFETGSLVSEAEGGKSEVTLPMLTELPATGHGP